MLTKRVRFMLIKPGGRHCLAGLHGESLWARSDEVGDAGRHRFRPATFTRSALPFSTGVYTRMSGYIGTPTYMSPESAEELPVGPAVDIYGTGIVLYELVSGSPPFVGGNPVRVLRRHIDEAPARPFGIDDEIWALLTRMLVEAIPSERPTALVAAEECARLESSFADAETSRPSSLAGRSLGRIRRCLEDSLANAETPPEYGEDRCLHSPGTNLSKSMIGQFCGSRRHHWYKPSPSTSWLDARLDQVDNEGPDPSVPTIASKVGGGVIPPDSRPPGIGLT